MRESFCNCIKRVSRETISTGNAIPKVSSRNDKSPNNYFTAKAAVKAKTQGQGCTKQGHLRQNTLFIVPCFCGTFFSRFRFDKLESYEKMKNTKKNFFCCFTFLASDKKWQLDKFWFLRSGGQRACLLPRQSEFESCWYSNHCPD